MGIDLMAVVCATSEKNGLVKKRTAGKLKAVPTTSGCLKSSAVKLKASDYVGLPNKSTNYHDSLLAVCLVSLVLCLVLSDPAVQRTHLDDQCLGYFVNTVFILQSSP